MTAPGHRAHARRVSPRRAGLRCLAEEARPGSCLQSRYSDSEHGESSAAAIAAAPGHRRPSRGEFMRSTPSGGCSALRGHSDEGIDLLHTKRFARRGRGVCPSTSTPATLKPKLGCSEATVSRRRPHGLRSPPRRRARACAEAKRGGHSSAEGAHSPRSRSDATCSSAPSTTRDVGICGRSPQLVRLPMEVRRRWPGFLIEIRPTAGLA